MDLENINYEDLREIRKNLEMTQKEFAEAIGYSESHYRHVENSSEPFKAVPKRMQENIRKIYASREFMTPKYIRRINEFSAEINKELEELNQLLYEVLIQMPANPTERAAYITLIKAELGYLKEIKKTTVTNITKEALDKYKQDARNIAQPIKAANNYLKQKLPIK